MRLLAVLALGLGLGNATALAQPSRPSGNPSATRSQIPYRVVRTLVTTQQALLFDRDRGTHVLAEVGKSLDGGYEVIGIDNFAVTLVLRGTQIILAAPESDTIAVGSLTGSGKPSPRDPAPIDPYAPAPFGPQPAPPPGEPMDPYGAVDQMPIPAPAPAPSPSTIEVSLTRYDLDVARADFTKLAASIQVTQTPTNVRLDMVAADSIFAKVGLRAGDVVAAVDGKILRTLDDAAELYARAPAMRFATVIVIRAGKPITLRVTIR